MERAALQITNWLVQHFSAERKLLFFAGPGNNGGDALAIARQMAELDFLCEVLILNTGKPMSESAAINLDRLQKQSKAKISTLNSIAEFPKTNPADIFVEGLFGSGLTRPLDGFAAALVQKINSLPNTVVAIDIPSGLMGENNTGNIPENIIQACYTLTFQFPKLSFLFPENEQFTGKWEVLPIRLHPEGIDKTPTDFYWIDKTMVKPLFPPRSKFGHKGNYGHALLIAGSYGKMGTAILASRGCLRAGAGLLTTHVPHLGIRLYKPLSPKPWSVSISTIHSLLSSLICRNFQPLVPAPESTKKPIHKGRLQP
jgi:NAD(P)H-hydrate epimerase